MEDLPPVVGSDAALHEAIEMLAALAETQLAYLKKLGTYPCLDELALEFDDEYGRVQPGDGPDEATLSPEAASALARLGAMSGDVNGQLWEPSALSGQEWSEVRTLALTALSVLGDKCT